MTGAGAGVVLEHAHVVHHDRVAAQTLSFTAGRVSAGSAGALRIDLRDHLIFPGLINAHDHLQLNNIPRLAHAQPFANSYEWIDAFETHRADPNVAAAVKVPSAARYWQGGLKNVIAGATTVAHHDPWNPVFDEHEFPVNVLREFGWSHSLRLGEQRGNQPPRYGPAVRASYLDTPHSYPWFIHLAEGTDEVARGELASLDALGCLAQNTVLVHGVGMTERDVDRVIECGASLVWCPASNVELFGRTVDAGTIRRLYDAGRLTLGTDSRLTGSRDILEEQRAAAKHSDLSPRELLLLVTERAARVLRTPMCGGLDIGQHGDCVIVRATADPFETLLKVNRSEIRAVVRGGEPVIADPDFDGWFAERGIATVKVRLDGKPKLIARSAEPPDCAALEPGLQL